MPNSIVAEIARENDLDFDTAASMAANIMTQINAWDDEDFNPDGIDFNDDDYLTDEEIDLLAA
jgi:hypothetical protein